MSPSRNAPTVSTPQTISLVASPDTSGNIKRMRVILISVMGWTPPSASRLAILGCVKAIQEQEASMKQITTIGLDLMRSPTCPLSVVFSMMLEVRP